MFKRTNLLFESDPFDFSLKTKSLFIDSFKEMFKHHYENNNIIKKIYNYKNFPPASIIDEESLKEMPYLMVNLFKERSFLTGLESDLALTLTSSGTSGHKSVMRLDVGSLARVKKLAYNVYDSLGACENKKYNYLCFTYDPKVAHDLGTAFTDELLTSFTDKNEVYYAIHWSEEKNDWSLCEQGVVDKLIEFSKSEYPTRILGFPAFLFKIIKDFNLTLDLGADSWLLTGGGWKNHADEQIPKDEFREFIEKSIGIPKCNQRDLFGMVEHGIPYVDSENGKLRIPNYARVYIRDPKTLEILDYGEPGIIQFLCCYNSSYPNFNILTTDWGVINKSDDSHPADILEILGRAGLNKHKGCALKANELLRTP
jgi:phenylacetate-coenzyme A ligase PaaK-like adenylate-forming protein